jgi:protein-S-isoprenylcysteine O-methyltransferase Ste14
MHAPSTPTIAGSVPAPPTLSTLTRLGDYAVMTLAVVLSVGSVALFASESRPILVRLDLSPAAALWWNAAVSFVFFAQHSVTVRRPFRARLAVVIPARYDGAFYAITSGIALALVVLLWQPAGRPMFVLHGVPRLLIDVAALAAIAGFAWGALALHGFDPCGLRPIRAHLRGASPAPTATAARATPLVVRGPYRWVRHPLYSFVIVLLWADADMTPSRLVIAAVWTAWICVGARLEERDLISEFGDRYRSYRRRVPFLVPWRRPVAAQEVSETRVTT